MAIELTALIHADRQQIQSDAQDLAGSAMPIAPASPAHHGGAQVNFADSFQQAIHGVDNQERVAADKMAEVDSGRSDDLVGAMLSSQEASLSFSMLMQVRNKVMGAVEELTKLPV